MKPTDLRRLISRLAPCGLRWSRAGIGADRVKPVRCSLRRQ
ncbi:hypothetical protein [Nocardia brevicatena]|nr:hypothetical protein [Nocardia brevicatena]